MHVVLLGDSVFDNTRYVEKTLHSPGGPDVLDHIGSLLPEGWSATSCAYDGGTTHSLAYHLKDIPDGANHLVVSVGGNDALGASRLLDVNITQPPKKSKPQKIMFFQIAMRLLQKEVARFAENYQKALDEVLDYGLPVTVCTIYNPDYGDGVSDVVAMALSAYNDVILRYALAHGLDVFELRDVVNVPSDFTASIEPSVTGGWKIAAAIMDHVGVLVPA